MKFKLLLLIFLMSTSFALSQNKTLWQKQSFNLNQRVKPSKQNLPKNQSFTLNINALKQALVNAPKRENSGLNTSQVVLSFPNDQGKFESYRIAEASVLSPELQQRYPEIRSYIGKGIDNPSAVIRFSISPLGFQSMRLSADMPATFIEVYSEDLTLYAAYKRSDRIDYSNDFECEVTDTMNEKFDNSDLSLRNADDGILRTYRLAVSTTGEYTAYHGGTKALALAAINQTMTRVNGIFENDFNVTMVIIGNNDDVIYTNSGSDPYTNSSSYNSQLQSTLTSVIGESNYDIGHLFARASNNGNAGCIGCVCVNGQKGSGFTSRTDPEGDPFDVDYVAHEIGHQFGGNHTWTFNGNEGTNAQMEPGSGSTIMGYAGITGATDVQSNSDPYFHARSIEQITNYIKTTSCQTNTATGNAVPTVNAGSNYTIPKGTAFVLEGSASDANSGDVLTYCWEQYDENNASTTYPSVSATSGVAFRSYNPTTDNKRYFPGLSTVKTGATSWQWEAVPNVARNLNFRLTVRDNRVGGATNNSDDMVVTVNGTAGPFVVNSPNTNVTWDAGTTQTVTWNVAGTTGNGVNAANVDIFLSTDGGDTYPISLATGVPNDGSHDIVVPNNQGNQNRVMVRGANNIFFDISNSNFTIGAPVVCNANVPAGLVASNVAETTATLSWNAVPGATYDLRYRQTGTSTWTTIAVTGISSNISGLTALTEYEAQVRSKCTGGSNSAYSSSVTFTTTDVQLNYCGSASTNTNDEYISRVQLNTIDNSSGPQFYSDFTGISTTLTKDTQYTITITPTWTGTVYNEAYGVWIDYNRDGDFTDAGEEVFIQGNTQATSVSGSFTIPSGAVENATRMRVTMRYNQVPGPCDNFTYGEVEDYTVNIEGSGPDTEAPVISLIGSANVSLELGDSYSDAGATASDNVDGNLTSSIVVGGDTVDTNTVGSYVITYNVSDAAGNAATEVIRTVTVNPDTIAPVITLNGASTINLNVGDIYTEQGATATDNLDGNLTSNIVISGTVNTASAGTYFVNYNVSDSSGNAAAQVTRTVVVNADTTPPVIVLNGSSTINLLVGDTYNEQGATATDNIDGNLTSSIVIGGSVNTSVAGIYNLTYNVSDSAGNAATEVIRTVNVSNPSSGCSGGVSSFPYSEGFESNFGAWTQSTADDINWTRDANGTPSSNTGPASAIEGSFYVFVEASGNGTGYPNKQAILNSPCFNLATLSEATFTFKYHQYGSSNMGTIDLELSEDDGASWTSIWNSSGNLGNSWQTADINLNAYVGGSIQLRFNRVTGSTWQADIAIDDISLTEGDVVTPGCSGGITAYPYSEGFESSLGAWTQSSADDINWTRDANGTPSNGTGPSSAIQGSFYIYVEASGNNTGYPNKRAIINSPCFDLSSQSSATFSFNYHQYGSSNMGTLNLEASNDNGASWTSIWNSSGNLGNSWQSANVSLSAYVGGSVQLRFNRLTGGTWQADIAIDNINLTTSSSAKGEVVNEGSSFEDIKEIKLYPNPVKGNQLHVATTYTNVTYEIYNNVGQIVAKGALKNNVIDISNLDGAVYQIRFSTEGETLIKRFIKQ